VDNDAMPDDLDIVSLEGALRGAFAGPVRYIPSTGSTNADALAWAADGAPEGAIVVTDYQSAGRGRWGRSWAAPAGTGLLFSLVLRPSPEKVGLLTTLAGVACCGAIRDATGLDALLRWPNDVLVGSRKTAGILVETRVAGARVEVAVVGVGVNVSTRADQWPPELAGTATSLAIELGDPPGRIALLGGILGALESRYSQWASESLIKEAAALSAVLGNHVRVLRGDGRSVEGLARGLTASGALEIESSDGTVAVESGEVQRLTAP
jgi:BirA family biotin operon repressor/biotin-[acetyl-CoA-carboxylase] ligase